MISRLERLIHGCMAATQLKVGASHPQVVAFISELLTDPAMQQQARTMLANTPASIEQRDHISKWRNDLLRQALAQVDHGG